MSNAIDRLEELEGRATKVLPTPWKPEDDPGDPDVGVQPCYGIDGLVMMWTSTAHTSDLHHMRDFILTLRNAFKPLLAVVRAGERVQALMDEMTTPASLQATLRPADTIREEMHAAREALRLALATLKETTL